MSNKVMELNRNQIEQMRKQADYNLQIYDEIQKHKAEMLEMKTEFKELYTEMKEEFEEFKNTVPLTGPQADRLHMFATKKGHQFTKQFFGQEVSQELYMKKFGHLIRGIYTAIKKRFEVNKYTLVRRVDGEQAIAFVENLTLKDLPQNYMRLTDSQIDTAARHGDYNVLEKLG